MDIHKKKDDFRVQSDIHDHDTRGKFLIRRDFFRLKRSQQGPEFWGVSLYNKLPGGAKNLPTKQLKSKLIKILTTRAFYSLDEFNKMTMGNEDFL